MVRLAALALVLGCGAPPVKPPPPVVARPAAPPGLRLPRTFTPTGYTAHVVLDGSKFEGALVMTGELAAGADAIWVDASELVIAGAVASGGHTTIKLDVAPTAGDAVALRPRKPLAPGPWKIAISYRGVTRKGATAGLIRDELDGKPYWHTAFEPVGARRVFPCIDEPDRRAPWQITLDVPRDLVAVGNAPVASETWLDAKRKQVVFARTAPLPSYLVGFAVGAFEEVDAGATETGAPIRVLALHADHVRDVAGDTARLVGALEIWLASPMPASKLDVVELPDRPRASSTGAPGLITFPARFIYPGAKLPAAVQRFEWSTLIGHAVARMWFEGLVTPAWWNDAWLGVAVADRVTHDAIGGPDPAWDSEVAETEALGIALAQAPNRTAVRREPATPDELHDVVERAQSGRAAVMLRALEVYIGRDRFQDAVRAYLTAHTGNSTTAQDLLAELDRAAPRPVGELALALLEHPEVPTLAVTASCARGEVHLAVERTGQLTGALPACVAFERGGTRGERCVVIDGASANVSLGRASCPKWVLPDAGGRGFYRTAWTPAALADLLRTGWVQLTAPERLAVALDVLEPDHDYTAAELSLLAPLAATTDRHLLFALDLALDRLLRRVTGADRPALAAWILKALGARARAVGIAPRDADDVTAIETRWDLISLAGRAGDPQIIDDARKLSPSQLPADLRELPLRVLAANDPRAAQDALAAFARDRGRSEAVDAIPDLPTLLVKRGAQLAKLPPGRLIGLYGTTCDPAQRAALAALAKQLLKPPDEAAAVAAMDQCLAAQARLAPILHAWLGTAP